MTDSIRTTINTNYQNIWPSDHPLLISNNLKYASWNILVQQSGRLAKKIDRISYHETNSAFVERLNIVVNIINVLDVNNVDIIALQEVETEAILRIATSNLCNRYRLLFVSDPGKPRGHLLLFRNITIEKVPGEAKIIKINKINTSEEQFIGETFSYNKQEIVFCNTDLFHDASLEIVKEDIIDMQGHVITTKTVALPILYYDLSDKKKKLFMSVHIPQRSQYSDTSELLGLFHDIEFNESIIMGDFNLNLFYKKDPKLYRPYWDHLYINGTRNTEVSYLSEKHMYDFDKNDNTSKRNVMKRLLFGHDLDNIDVDQLFLTDGIREDIFNFRKDILTELSFILTSVEMKDLQDLDRSKQLEVIDRYVPIHLLLELLYSNTLEITTILNDETPKMTTTTDHIAFKRYSTNVYNMVSREEIEIDLLLFFINEIEEKTAAEVINGKTDIDTVWLPNKISFRDIKLINLLKTADNTYLKINISKFMNIFDFFIGEEKDISKFKEKLITSYEKYRYEDWFTGKYGRNSYNRFPKSKVSLPRLKTTNPFDVNVGGNIYKLGRGNVHMDGNCLFNSVASLLEKEGVTGSVLRQIVVKQIQSILDDVDTVENYARAIKDDWHGYRREYDELPNRNLVELYATAMSNDPVQKSNIPNSFLWGGNIELVILAKHLNIGINVVDQYGRVTEINPMGTDNIIFIFYSGNHYDPLKIINLEVSTTKGETKVGGYKINYTKI